MNNKKINVIHGDAKDLNISPVYTHISPGKPKIAERKDIVIPENKKKKKK